MGRKKIKMNCGVLSELSQSPHLSYTPIYRTHCLGGLCKTDGRCGSIWLNFDLSCFIISFLRTDDHSPRLSKSRFLFLFRPIIWFNVLVLVNSMQAAPPPHAQHRELWSLAPRLLPLNYQPASPCLKLTSWPSARVHVEQAPRRREAVTSSGGRWGAGHAGGEVCPGHVDWVVGKQVTTSEACARRTGRLCLFWAKMRPIICVFWADYMCII